MFLKQLFGKVIYLYITLCLGFVFFLQATTAMATTIAGLESEPQAIQPAEASFNNYLTDHLTIYRTDTLDSAVKTAVAVLNNNSGATSYQFSLQYADVAFTSEQNGFSSQAGIMRQVLGAQQDSFSFDFSSLMENTMHVDPVKRHVLSGYGDLKVTNSIPAFSVDNGTASLALEPAALLFLFSGPISVIAFMMEKKE